MMNEWSGCSDETLSLIYHSIEPSECYVNGRPWNPITRESWHVLLVEIGEEIDRRRDGATVGHAVWSREPSFLADD